MSWLAVSIPIIVDVKVEKSPLTQQKREEISDWATPVSGETKF